MAFAWTFHQKLGLFVVVILLGLCRSCLSTVTVHDLKTRNWPIPDPNKFGIASNHGGSNTRSREGLATNARSPSASFITRDGRSVAVFDDVLDYRLLMAWFEYIHLVGVWRLHNYNGESQNENETKSSGISWTATFNTEIFSNSESGRHMLSLVKSLPRHHGKGIDDEKDFEPYKVVCNILRRGDSIRIHQESQSHGTEYTAILYLNQMWKKNDYGDLLFYDERDVFATVGPKFNRIVIWDSSIEYLTRPPSMGFKQSQLFLMAHFTQNHTKAEQSQQDRSRQMEEREKAVAELFPSMIGPVGGKIDVGKHVTQKYMSANGKKIFVFDNLFSVEDLDKLRMFTVNHGNYFFDDSVDTDSDNVQWIAAFPIDDFTQSRLWDITRQVAKYVSGTDKWFPYDIACNIIRSFDYTRIHEDCEKQEDEWTFLLYLNPNWTENFYGETVFKQTDRDDAENIASVLPRYGRVAIFQGIIPHSARPPSPIFTGARLSFAVKLSVNPWVARVKTLKQEFAHEEYMHHSALSLMKYYNDPDMEARYQEELLESVKEQNEMEYLDRERFQKHLQEVYKFKNDDDGREQDDDEEEMDEFREDDEDDDGEFDFRENVHFHGENEFSEINQRRNYIYNLFTSLNHDADALTTHYLQFVKDNEVMKKMYAEETAKLI